MPPDVKESKTLNAIQVRIDDNIRMLAELHARWEREDEIARNNKMTKVCTITPTSNTEISSASIPPTMSDPVSQLYILVMSISQAGLEGYWGYHSQADTFGRRLPAWIIGLTRPPRETLHTNHNQVAQL